MLVPTARDWPGGMVQTAAIRPAPDGSWTAPDPLAAFLAAISGWLYAHMSRFVSPASFDAAMGIEYLMMAMIGAKLVF